MQQPPDNIPKRPLRALLVDDHPIVLDAVAGALIASSTVSSVDCAQRLQDARKMLERDPAYDIVVLDLSLDDATGLSALITLRETFPDVPVLVFSSTEKSDVVMLALEGGARGYVPKSSPMEVFLRAVRVVLAGSVYVPPRAPSLAPYAVGNKEPQLTPRQIEVFRLLLQGMPNKVIGSRLGMAEGTVKTHVNVLFRVYKVNNRAQLVVRAHQLGLI